MKTRKNENQKYINLRGYVKQVLKKDDHSIVFAFKDESVGEVKCQAGKDSILYNNMEPNTKYLLQVVLKGRYTVSSSNYVFLNNNLYVKHTKFCTN